MPNIERHADTTVAAQSLMLVYKEARDIRTVFVEAYRECVGDGIESAQYDFRCYELGILNNVPDYIRCACRIHNVGLGQKDDQ